MAYRVAVVGATGAVGREIIKTLAERNFPVSEVVALASARSVGQQISFKAADSVWAKLAATVGDIDDPAALARAARSSCAAVGRAISIRRSPSSTNPSTRCARAVASS